MEVAGVLGGGALLRSRLVEVHHFVSVLQHACGDALTPGSSLEMGVHQLPDVKESRQPKGRHGSVFVEHVLPPL